LKTVITPFRPTGRGFFERNWKAGNNVQQTGQSYSLELSDRFKLGNFSLRNQFFLQHGPQIGYRASLGVDLAEYGDLEITQQARNTKVADFYKITHYNSRNGLNTKASVTFEEPHYRPVLTMSSLYNQTMEVFDRKTMKLNKRTSVYGVDSSFSFNPLQQINYSLYYQSKGDNYDLIVAYVRKTISERFYVNNIIAGMKYKTLDNKKLLAKFTYNIEDRVPQVDLMIKAAHSQDKRIKTFHKISSNFRAGSGFSFNLNRFKLLGMAEVSLLNRDSNTQPFSLSLRVEMNDDKRTGVAPVPNKRNVW
jgi:hypothetical protein